MSAAAAVKEFVRVLQTGLNKILPLTLKRQNLNRNSVAATIKMMMKAKAKAKPNVQTLSQLAHP